MNAFYKHGYTIEVIHSDHETTIPSTQIFLNKQGIQLKNSNDMFKVPFPLGSIKCQVQIIKQIIFPIIYGRAKMINHMPNSIHLTVTPSVIFKGTKINLNFQKLVPFGSYAAFHYVKRVDSKYQSYIDNSILLYLTDDTTSNMTDWIPGRNTEVIINKYTIKAHPSDFGFQ